LSQDNLCSSLVTGDAVCTNSFSIHCTAIIWIVSFKGKELVRMGETQWTVLRSGRFTPEKSLQNG